MQLEDISLALERIQKTTAAGNWDPAKHPRAGTAPNPGWFAPSDGGDAGIEPTLVSDKTDDDGRLHLPPAERNDEIGDLLEWIANSKPKDVPAIEGEIRRLFYDKDDALGGSIMQRALADAVRHPDLASREKLLEGYEPITHRDPELAGEISDDIASAAFLRVPEILPALRSILPGARTAETVAIPTAEAIEQARSEFWKLGWSARGFAIHEAMGGNLPWWFKGIDDFSEGVATSFKTIDLDAATYQHAPNLTSTINGYVNKLAAFNGKSYTNWEVESGKITSRALKLIVPKGSMTPAQKAVIDAATQRAQLRGITLSAIPF
ncbi:MAG TPA: hypothetical protein VJR47_21585 [Stellaceae bacterium]|nr:hypothetical protein [Stellaceae bacterium]